jgi:hypothetical protein
MSKYASQHAKISHLVDCNTSIRELQLKLYINVTHKYSIYFTVNVHDIYFSNKIAKSSYAAPAALGCTSSNRHNPLPYMTK